MEIPALNAGVDYNKLGQMQNMEMNALQQRAMSQQINANVAASEAFQKAFNPQTGKVDLNAAAGYLSQDPRGAYNVPQVMAQIQQQQNAQLENQVKQYELANKQISGMKQNIGALMGNSNLGHADVIGSIGNMVNQGLLTKEQAAQELMTMPQDPAQLRGWVQQHAMAVMDADKQLQALSPQLQQIQQGNQTSLINTNPFYGQGVGQVGAFQQGMSPGEAAQPVTIVNPQTGAQQIITKQQFAQAQGMGQPIQTSMPQGSEEVTKGAVGRFNEQVAALPEIQNAQQGLRNAMGMVDQTRTGPGMDTLMSVTGVLNTLGLPIAKDQTTNYQELHKYLNNQLNTAMKAAGTVKSDTGLESFIGGQPNAESMNPKALKSAMKFVYAQNQGAVARTQAAQNYVQQNGANSLPEFEAKWSKAYSPELMYMRNLDTPEEKQQYWDSLNTKQQDSIKKSMRPMGELGAWQ